jgi:hypothetical protein
VLNQNPKGSAASCNIKSHYFEIANFTVCLDFIAVHLGNIPFTFACIVPIDANVLIPKFETS